MSQASRRPGLRPGRAADVKSGLEHRSYGRSATESQDTPNLADFRLQRAVAKLHRLGPRPLYELLVELGAQRLIRSEIEALVERYVARLNPEMLLVAGGNKFTPSPIHVVGGRQ